MLMTRLGFLASTLAAAAAGIVGRQSRAIQPAYGLYMEWETVDHKNQSIEPHTQVSYHPSYAAATHAFETRATEILRGAEEVSRCRYLIRPYQGFQEFLDRAGTPVPRTYCKIGLVAQSERGA